MPSKNNARTASLGALVLAAALGLAGCGSGDAGSTGGMDHGSSGSHSTPPSATGPSASTEFNTTDITFVQMMLPHHEQAVSMSETLLEKGGVSPEVAALAEEVQAAQQPEIDTMKSWLATWGQDEMGHGGMDYGGGMATDAELEEFEAADGATGQRMYLEMMVAHHEGAITMAESEAAGGKNPDAIQLAKNIATTQQQEIAVMEDLLSKL